MATDEPPPVKMGSPDAYKRPGLVAFIDGVTAAAVGAISGAVVVLAKRSLIDVPTVLFAVGVAVVLWRWKKLQEPWIILAAAALGLMLYPLRH
ncbi:MAG: chromate transporter [Aquabacterium sp.]